MVVIPSMIRRANHAIVREDFVEACNVEDLDGLDQPGILHPALREQSIRPDLDPGSLVIERHLEITKEADVAERARDRLFAVRFRRLIQECDLRNDPSVGLLPLPQLEADVLAIEALGLLTAATSESSRLARIELDRKARPLLFGVGSLDPAGMPDRRSPAAHRRPWRQRRLYSRAHSEGGRPSVGVRRPLR